MVVKKTEAKVAPKPEAKAKPESRGMKDTQDLIGAAKKDVQGQVGKLKGEDRHCAQLALRNLELAGKWLGQIGK